MRKSAKAMSTGDQVAWGLTAGCLLLTGLLTLMTYAMDLGAASHDAFCPEHGWAVPHA